VVEADEQMLRQALFNLAAQRHALFRRAANSDRCCAQFRSEATLSKTTARVLPGAPKSSPSPTNEKGTGLARLCSNRLQWLRSSVCSMNLRGAIFRITHLKPVAQI
jgi:hypothetical protein